MPIIVTRHFIHKGGSSGNIYKGAAYLPFNLEFAMSRPTQWFWCSDAPQTEGGRLPIDESNIVGMDHPEEHGRERPSP